MNSVRTFCTKPWVTRPIIAIWLLWSGMFLCLLPSDAEMGAAVSASSHVNVSISQHLETQVAVTDCVEVSHEGTEVNCTSEAGGTLVFSDLIKFTAISSDMGHRLAAFVPFRSMPLDLPTVLKTKPVSIYLFLCSFLK